MSDIDAWVEKRACSKNGTRNMSEIKAIKYQSQAVTCETSNYA